MSPPCTCTGGLKNKPASTGIEQPSILFSYVDQNEHDLSVLHNLLEYLHKTITSESVIDMVALLSSDSEPDSLVTELVSLFFDEFSAIPFCHEIDKKLTHRITQNQTPTVKYCIKWHVGFKIREDIIQMANIPSRMVCDFLTKSTVFL